MTKMTKAKRIIPLLYCLIFFETLGTLATPRSVWSYFQAPLFQNSLFEELEKKEPCDPNGPIVMYLANQKVDSGIKCFSKGVSLLTPVDILKTNFQLYQIFHRPQRINEDPLANLIYANIELKRYMDKYKELEEAARKILLYKKQILAEFSKNYNLIATEVVFKKKLWQNINEELGETTADKPKEKQNVLVKALRKLNFFKHRMIAALSRGAIDDSTEISLALERPSHPIQLKDNSNKSTSQAGPQTNSYAALKSLYYRASISSNQALHSSDLEDSNPSHHIAESENSTRVDIAGTPWIIKAPIEFLAWAMKNKLEAIILILFVLMIIKFIGTIFRRS